MGRRSGTSKHSLVPVVQNEAPSVHALLLSACLTCARPLMRAPNPKVRRRGRCGTNIPADMSGAGVDHEKGASRTGSCQYSKAFRSIPLVAQARFCTWQCDPPASFPCLLCLAFVGDCTYVYLLFQHLGGSKTPAGLTTGRRRSSKKNGGWSWLGTRSRRRQTRSVMG